MGNRARTLLFVPNIIGYFRIILVFIAWTQWEFPDRFLGLFLLSGGLDFVDGIVARRLEQTSLFGAWLDVVIDNFSRSMIWTGVLPNIGFALSSLEWLTFVCTHQIGKHWKAPSKKQPWFVVKVLGNNFNTPLGLWVILSIWFLPAWFYAVRFYELTFTWANLIFTITLVTGRLVAFFVEGWFILQHMLVLLQEDLASKSNLQ